MRVTSASRRIPIIVALLGVAASLYGVLGILSSSDWNPTALVKFSNQEPERFAYAQEQFGDVITADGLGHDGRFFFIQATDPFYLQPEVHAVQLDRPTYRAQRMLYPTVVGGFGQLGANQTAWTMVLVNVLAIGAGSYFTARIAQHRNLSPLLGAAFLANPAMLVSTFIDSGDVLALHLLVAAIWMLDRERDLLASLTLTAAVLTRETMVIAVVGLIAYRLLQRTRPSWHLALPFLIPAVWWVYVRVQIGYLSPEIQDLAAIGLPFQGFVEAVGSWTIPMDALDLLMGVAILVMAILVAWRTSRRPTLIGMMVVGFSLLAVLLSGPVWVNYYDSSRAVAPLITGYILLVPNSKSPDGGQRRSATQDSNELEVKG